MNNTKYVILANLKDVNYVLCRHYIDRFTCRNLFIKLNTMYNGCGRSINSDALIFDNLIELDFFIAHNINFLGVNASYKVCKYTPYNRNGCLEVI